MKEDECNSNKATENDHSDAKQYKNIIERIMLILIDIKNI